MRAARTGAVGAAARTILLLALAASAAAASACASGGGGAPIAEAADPVPDAEGFITTRSGLRYKVLRDGTGPAPRARDRVLIHYSCRLEDGTVIDSSYERGAPDVLTPRDLIRGFREALLLMPVGSHLEVIVPGRLGYGRAGIDGVVGPNETLIFEIEMLRIGRG